MTPNVRREVGWLRTLAKTRRAAALKATQQRLVSGTAIAKPKAKASSGESDDEGALG
jgi:hypothetical protein